MWLLKTQVGSIAPALVGCPDELSNKGYNLGIYMVYDLTFVKTNSQSSIYFYVFIYMCVYVSIYICRCLHGYGEKCVGSCT